MFQFLLSIRGSFLAVRVGRMPRRCAATPVLMSHWRLFGAHQFWKQELIVVNWHKRRFLKIKVIYSANYGKWGFLSCLLPLMCYFFRKSSSKNIPLNLHGAPHKTRHTQTVRCFVWINACYNDDLIGFSGSFRFFGFTFSWCHRCRTTGKPKLQSSYFSFQF